MICMIFISCGHCDRELGRPAVTCPYCNHPTGAVLVTSGGSVSKEDRLEKLEATCSDMASKLLYYDRKEDEELPVGAIEEMVLSGEVTVDELLGWITTPIRDSLTKKPKKKKS